MPVTKNRFACGHKGLGSFCHRCAQADKLEEYAKNPSSMPEATPTPPPENDKKGKRKNKPSVDTQALLDEAKRLREGGKGRTY
jgi:hypothetical protein